MYHRVIDDKRAPLTNSTPGIIVSDRTFEMHMRTLRRNFKPVSLEQLRENVENGTALPTRSCLVTFDDGWLDNYEIAFPILQKYEIPAVVFLPLNFISTDSMFWQEEILMWLTWLLSSREEKKLAQLAKILRSGNTPAELTLENIRSFVTTLKSCPEAQIDKTLKTIRTKLASYDEPPHYNRYMTWSQITEMNAAGISFASHALSHRILCRLPVEKCRNELLTSRAVLQDRLGVPTHAIAYPNGDFDQRVLVETKAAGYTMAFTTHRGLVGQECGPLAIPRMNIHDNNSRNEALFMCTCVNLF